MYHAVADLSLYRYVLSPTHLHEFRSADKIVMQSPVMSLYLPDQKLGAHSSETSNSHKFMLKGRQTGSMHRGHAWVFRSESYDTMLAWYEDLKGLTDKKGQARLGLLQSNNGQQNPSDEASPNNDGSRPGSATGAEGQAQSSTLPPSVNDDALDEEDEVGDSPASPPPHATPPPRAAGGFMKSSSRAVSKPINFGAAHNPMSKPKPRVVSSLVPHQESPAETEGHHSSQADASPAASSDVSDGHVLATSASSGGGDSAHLNNTDTAPEAFAFETSGSTSSSTEPPIRQASSTPVTTYAPQPRKVGMPPPSLPPSSPS